MSLKKKYVLMFIIALTYASPVLAQSERQNYVKSITKVSESDSLVEYDYADGLGRSSEIAKVGFTPGGKDLVTLQEYDKKGLLSKSWLPVAVSGATFSLSQEVIASEAQSQYVDMSPFQSMFYEPSPLSRNTQTFGAGAAWRSANACAKTEYLSNGREEILALSVNQSTQPTVLSVSYYAPGISTTYAYNIRGWVTGKYNSVCSQRLYYNDKRDKAKSVSQWNGNLSSYTWNSKSYDYSYDVSDMLKAAYSTDIQEGKSVEGLYDVFYSYDSMGNLVDIQRNGVNADTGEPGLRDNVVLEYDGNQLKKVSDPSSSTCSYNFYVTDHLGNNRYVVDSKGKVIQANNYYPFGGTYGDSKNESSQAWRFGGKELDRNFDVYDFLDRWYDPTLG